MDQRNIILVGFMGTYIGKKVLDKVSNKHFHVVLKFALTFIALRLIWGFLTAS